MIRIVSNTMPSLAFRLAFRLGNLYPEFHHDIDLRYRLGIRLHRGTLKVEGI